MAEQIFSAVLPSKQFAEKINALSAEFSRQFADFETQKGRFKLINNFFAINVEAAPTIHQMELIELQCDDMLKSKHDSVGAAQFPYFLPDIITHPSCSNAFKVWQHISMSATFLYDEGEQNTSQKSTH